MQTSNEKRPNFYLLLELPFDPAEESEDVIRKALHEKLTYWRRNANHPTLQQKMKYYISLKQQIEKTMLGNVQARKAEASEAASQVRAEQQKQDKESEEKLDAAIKVLTSKGYILDTEVASLAQRFQRSEAEVTRKVQVEVRKANEQEPGVQKTDGEPETFSTTKLNKIMDLMRRVDVTPRKGKVPTLYDFLDMPDDAEGQALISISKRMQDELSRKPPGVDTIEYKKDLHGYAKSIFLDDAQRSRYDESLKKLRFDNIKVFIDLAAEHREITVPVYQQLLVQAMEEGVPQQYAEEQIIAYCLQKQYKYRLDGNAGGSAAVQTVNQCGYCGTFNAVGAQHCAQCGESLTVTCSICNEQSPSSAKHCTKCGISFEKVLRHKQFMQDGHRALSANHVQEAEDMFVRAQLLLDNNEVKQAMAQLQVKKKEISDYIHTIEQHIAKEYFYTAHKQWKKLTQVVPHLDDYDHLEHHINRRLHEVSVVLHKASQAASAGEKTAYYAKALQLCADCEEAKEKIGLLPPAPPHTLQVEAQAHYIHLKWMPGEQIGHVIYEVIRRKGEAPKAFEDGELLGSTQDLLFHDRTAEVGVHYWYAVYAFRGYTRSKLAVVEGPAVRLEEVENLQVVPESNGMRITWKAASNIGLEIWKKEGEPPSGRGDGTRLSGIDATTVIDEDVTIGARYGYMVLTRFEDEHGKVQFSRGVTAEAVMIDAKPVMDISYKIQNLTVTIRWTEPERHDVLLYCLDQPVRMNPGQCLPFAKVEERLSGKKLQIKEGGKASLVLNQKQAVYILPVTKSGNYAVIGKQLAVKAIDEVSGVKGTFRAQGDLLVQWVWPNDTEKVLIIYSDKDFVKDPNDAGTVQVVYSKKDYSTFNGFIIQNVDSDRGLYITIYAAEETAGQMMHSSGTLYFHTTKPLPVISYRLKSENFLLFRKLHLVLEMKDKTASMPDLIVVKKRGSQPLTVEDGQEIYRLESSEGQGAIEPVNLTDHREKGCFIRVFFKNDEDAQKYLLDRLGKMELV